jgi:hypothetical protein
MWYTVLVVGSIFLLDTRLKHSSDGTLRNRYASVAEGKINGSPLKIISWP